MTQPVSIKIALEGAAAMSAQLGRVLTDAQKTFGGISDAGKSIAGGMAAADKSIDALTARIDRSNAAFERLRNSGKLTAEQLAKVEALRDARIEPLQAARAQAQAQRADLGVAGAREALNLRPFADTEAEIAKLRQAYATLAASGKLSAAELAQAYEAQQAAVARLTATMHTVGPATASAQAGARQAEQAIGQIGRAGQISAGQTKAAMSQLPAQFTDIVTSLQGGQSPLTVLIQQGGQIKDSFGGIGPTLRALGSVIGPALTNPITLVTAAVVALVAGFLAGQSESAALRNSLTLTGGAAGVTLGQIDALSRSVAASTGVTIGSARDITAALVAQGNLSGPALDSTARAVAQVARVSGQSADEIVKGFSSMSGGVAAWAAKTNQAYNFLTPATYAQIRALEAQGKTADAVKLASDALADSMATRQTVQLGYLEGAYKATTRAAGDFWDMLKGIGRDNTTEESVAALTGALAKMDAEITARGLGGKDNRFTKERANTAARLAALQQQQKDEQAAAAEKAKTDADNQRAIEDQSAAHQGALASVGRAGAAQRLAQLTSIYDQQQAVVDQAQQRGMISDLEAFAAKKQIDTARLDAEEAHLGRLAAIQSKAKPGTRDETLAQQAALLQIEAQRTALAGKRAILSRSELDVEPSIKGGNLFSEDTSAVDLARGAAVNQQIQDNRTMGLTLIKDAEAQARAQLAIEVEALEKRLELSALNGEARKNAEAQVTEFIRIRNEQLADQLKPAWQRLTEGWQDTTKVMRDSADRLGSSIVQSGEDAFINFAKTGKLQVKGLVDTIISEFARVQYQKLLGQASAAGEGDVIGGLIKLGAAYFGGVQVSGPGGAMGGDVMGGASNFGASGVLGAGRANGGLINGPGTGTSDDIPAMLSNGEYVIRAAAVKKLGAGLLDRLNHADRVPAFASGGLVGSSGPRMLAADAVPGRAGGASITQNITVQGGATAQDVQAAMRQAKAEALAAFADGRRRGAFA